MTDEPIKLTWKMIVIGQERVGKTSVIHRFVHESFKERYSETVGTDLFQTSLQLEDNVLIDLMIWDLGGQDYWRRLRSNFYQQSRGGFLVFDVNEPSSFTALAEWHKEATDSLNHPIPFIALGNKSDLENRISQEMLDEFKATYNFPIYLTSAKTGENVSQAFHELCKLMYQSYKEKNT